MHHAVREDRLWFQNNPVALVRFRTASPGEFTPLYAMGEQPPCFRPSVCRPSAPLRWVAVVDLMRFRKACSMSAMRHPFSTNVPARKSLPLPVNFTFAPWYLACASIC